MGLNHSPKAVSDNLVLMIDFANPKVVSGNALTNIVGNGLSINIANSTANSVTIANGYAEFNPVDLRNAATVYTISSETFFANNARQEVTMETAFYTYRTMSAFAANSTAAADRTRLISPRTGSRAAALGFGHGNGVFVAESNANDTWRVATFNVPEATYNTWVVVTQTTSSNGAYMLTYVNGTLRNNLTLAAPNGVLGNGGGYLIGRGEYDTLVNYNGRIAYLKVYNRVLSQEEVLANFNAVRGRFGL
jgi:hypothetical protein